MSSEIEQKCPHCGAELLNYPPPRAAEQDPGARQAACGSILWSDGTQSRTSRCYETAEYVDQLASARARIAELERERDVAREALRMCVRAHREPCDEHAWRGRPSLDCEQCKAIPDRMEQYWLDRAGDVTFGQETTQEGTTDE